MIRELHIRNLALIEELSIELEGGFSVFTGETGAGKSILIGAIGLLLGERASADSIRNGTDEAEVSGVFDVSGMRPSLSGVLRELTIEPEEGTLIIRRKISRSDRNKIYVNQMPLPLASLKKLGDSLIDFHGQHEHQSLLNEDTHREIIDELSGVKPFLWAYAKAYDLYTTALTRFTAHQSKARALAERKDLLEFQYRELKALDLKPGEEEELEKEISLLASSTERVSCVSSILAMLSDEGDSVEKRISAVRRKLEYLAKYDQLISAWISDVGNALSVFTELETFCELYLERTGSGGDPARIEKINARLAKTQRLKKKYGCTLEQLITKLCDLERDLQSIENVDADRDLLAKQVDSALKTCRERGSRLSKARVQAAASFDSDISARMETLGFKGGAWTTSCEPLAEPGPGGMETIRFLVQTNPGEQLLPLARTASGGEISRLMLAIKSVMAAQDQIPILIFDEIDTGIGGILAGEVAQTLFKLSQSHQVLCISHLHQIASLADHHFNVYKQTTGERTHTSIKSLSQPERIDEIARMLGGSTEISRQHARELLKKKS